MKVLHFALSYVVGFLIILLVASAVDTAGLALIPIFRGLKRIVPSLVLVTVVSALATYVGVVAFCWVASVTPLHVSCSICSLVVIVEYSSDSAQYRTARALSVIASDKKLNECLDVTIAQGKMIGHAFGFAVAMLAYLRGSPAF